MRISIVAMGASMTIDFLHGFLAALMPSMLVLAWLLWREAPMDSDVDF
jgi:F0F1-type ATP synthase assembly protein I